MSKSFKVDSAQRWSGCKNRKTSEIPTSAVKLATQGDENSLYNLRPKREVRSLLAHPMERRVPELKRLHRREPAAGNERGRLKLLQTSRRVGERRAPSWIHRR